LQLRSAIQHEKTERGKTPWQEAENARTHGVVAMLLDADARQGE